MIITFDTPTNTSDELIATEFYYLVEMGSEVSHSKWAYETEEEFQEVMAEITAAFNIIQGLAQFANARAEATNPNPWDKEMFQEAENETAEEEARKLQVEPF